MGSRSLRCHLPGVSRCVVLSLMGRRLLLAVCKVVRAQRFEYSIFVCLLSGCDIQDNGLVPIVEPEILLDGEHGIDQTLEVAQRVWSRVFYFLAENNVVFEGILLKPSMVTPGAGCKERATPEKVAEYTLNLLKRRVPPSVPGIMVRRGC